MQVNLFGRIPTTHVVRYWKRLPMRSGDRLPVPRSTDHHARKIAILLCTKDGATFLGDQLRSFADQTHGNWMLIASDDGSSDGTRELIAGFAANSEHTVFLRNGPRRGACANFLALAIDPAIEADFFAYSDQDDIWYRDKLDRALSWIAAVPDELPALYCGRTELTRVDGRSYGQSPLFARPPSFRNALIQNVGGGNTMVFNRAAKRLLEAAGVVHVVSHDWWTYQLVTAAGGTVLYDVKTVLRYRQHSNNLVGANIGWRARLARMRMILGGRFRSWNEINIEALKRLPADLMLPENRMVLEQFDLARSGPLLARLRHLWRSGVYRQHMIGNLGLVAATILKKL